MLTDTTGRELTFHYLDSMGRDIGETGYNGYFALTDIRQMRKNSSGTLTSVTLAKLGYSNVTINTNFASGITKDVPTNTVLSLLSSVITLNSDGNNSLYKFDYTSYGQVKTIHHYATISSSFNPATLAGYREISLVSYDLPSTTTSGNNAVQTDCPRFNQRSDDAYLWDSGVLTTFQYGANNAWTQVTTWDGTMQRDYFHLAANNTESWKDGLPYKMEAYASGQTPGVSTPKKTTLTTWVNDATWGRRVTDTTVTDGENNRSRFVSYLFGTYNLPVQVTETDITGGANIQLHRTVTNYLTGSPYIRASGTANNASNPSQVQRWLVGLPTAVYSYDGASTLLAKVTYAYDQTTYAGDNLLVHQLPGAGTIFNYNTDFALTSGTNAILARGNLTNVTRWDITPGSETDTAKAVVRATQYNTTGAPITQYLPNTEVRTHLINRRVRTS